MGRASTDGLPRTPVTGPGTGRDNSHKGKGMATQAKV